MNKWNAKKSLTLNYHNKCKYFMSQNEYVNKVKTCLHYVWTKQVCEFMSEKPCIVGYKVS